MPYKKRTLEELQKLADQGRLSTCEQCGYEFPSHRPSRFCRRRCQLRAYRNSGETRPCRYCGVDFRAIRADHYFCGKSCRGKAWRRGRRTRTVHNVRYWVSLDGDEAGKKRARAKHRKKGRINTELLRRLND